MAEYEIQAVRYAHLAKRTGADNYIIPGDDHATAMPLDYFVWVVKGGGRTFIVDTGFAEDMAAKRKRTITRPVAEGLKCIGVDPNTVGDVIITHMHYDHAGNHNLFPNAKYHIQDKEMQFCTGRCMSHAHVRHAFEAEDVAAMVRRLFQDRVQFHDGDSEITDGLSVHWVGGHTGGIQIVRVRTKRGWVVLASDASHYYGNFEQRRPFPIVHNVGDMLEGYDKMRKLSSSLQHIVPGHDPLVLQRYAPEPNGPADIVRLDIDPKG
jgi:glyoxylase-like metal-dependent hydrolase (beta-lactamase superfamily II)